jgi:LPXTG-motif cell wall-anchored protein
VTATAGVAAAVALDAGSTADLGASALASTGSDTADLAGFGAIAALLALAGVVLMFGTRNREAKAVRAARHQHRTH